MTLPASRRQFLQSSAALAATTAAATNLTSARAAETARPNKGIILKSVKWGMIREKGSVLDKFKLMKELGYDGMELVSPGIRDLAEAVLASKSTGMPIHGVVDQVHWRERLSSPSEATRAKGLAALKKAIGDTKVFGGSAVLLVPGKVSGASETHDDVWKRSIEEIRKATGLAAREGVRILIENVWNGFCETPEQLRDYIDEIDSPWVGVYFDIGNVRKFSPPEQWIRTLKSRIVKLDVKDWGKKNGFCKIGDGDVDWPEVQKALAEIRFTGWCTAEVGGGGRERLGEIAGRMDKALGL
jgi:hexulose-6-phosphate isomerase